MSKRSRSKKKSKNQVIKIEPLKNCTAVIRITNDIPSIYWALISCMECKISNVVIVDDSYHKSKSLYKDKRTKNLLNALRSKGHIVEIKRTLEIESIKSDLLIDIPWNCYMIESSFISKLEQVRENYKNYDRFAYSPTTLLPFSVWNVLIYLLFILDTFRALPYRYRLYQSNFVVFTTIHRQMGHPYIPSKSWMWVWRNRTFKYENGESGVSLRVPEDFCGLKYFLHLCNTHSSTWLVGWVFILLYTFLIAFPFYNWMPIIRTMVEAREPFEMGRIVLWIVHGVFASWLISSYFQNYGVYSMLDSNPKKQNKKDGGIQLYWIHTLFVIPLASFPVFCLLLIYGAFLYKGNRSKIEPNWPSLLKTKLSGSIALTEEDREENPFSVSDDDDTTGLKTVISAKEPSPSSKLKSSNSISSKSSSPPASLSLNDNFVEEEDEEEVELEGELENKD